MLFNQQQRQALNQMRKSGKNEFPTLTLQFAQLKLEQSLRKTFEPIFLPVINWLAKKLK